MNVTDLPEDIYSEIVQTMKNTLEVLGLEDDSSPDSVVTAIREVIDESRDSELDEEETEDRIYCLASLYGEMVVREPGWSWKMLKDDEGSEAVGIVSENEKYIMLPFSLMDRYLTNLESENTSELLYNMIKKGNLKPAPEDAYMYLV